MGIIVLVDHSVTFSFRIMAYIYAHTKPISCPNLFAFSICTILDLRWMSLLYVIGYLYPAWGGKRMYEGDRGSCSVGF